MFFIKTFAFSFFLTLASTIAGFSNSEDGIRGGFEKISSAATIGSLGHYTIGACSTDNFRLDVKRGPADFLVIGDASTDLDLYVFFAGEWYSSDGPTDNEWISIEVGRAGYVDVRVINRGCYRNHYQLILK